MKKLILIALMPLVGCQVNEKSAVKNDIREEAFTPVLYAYHTLIYDSCEYVEYSGGTTRVLTHKGNCKNCSKQK